VEGLAVPALAFGDDADVKVGQGVVAVGTALGEFRQTVTTGVVSGLGRTITASDGNGRAAEELENVIQTDTAINAGNSGGPLLNYQGQVIGVNVAMSWGAENIGFALPINLVKKSLENFETTGKFDRPFLGVSYQAISEKAALVNEIPQGLYVVSVVEGSAADKAGLQEGDVMTSLGGQSLKNEENELQKLIEKHKVGDKVEIEYFRDGEKDTTAVTLEKRE
jgi:S1-C subfamily serine protease